MSLKTNFPGIFARIFLLNPSFSFRIGFKAIGSFIDIQKVKILAKNDFHELDSEIPKIQRETKYGGLLSDLTTFFPPVDTFPSEDKLTLKKMAEDKKIVPFFFSVRKYVGFLHSSDRDAPIQRHEVPNDNVYQDFSVFFSGFSKRSHKQVSFKPSHSEMGFGVSSSPKSLHKNKIFPSSLGISGFSNDLNHLNGLYHHGSLSHTPEINNWQNPFSSEYKPPVGISSSVSYQVPINRFSDHISEAPPHHSGEIWNSSSNFHDQPPISKMDFHEYQVFLSSPHDYKG